MSDFPPIADYAFLSDCEDSCLIAPDGSVEWLCLPRPDSPVSSGPCSTALPARSASGPRTPWSPTTAATCPARWWSRPPGTPLRVGWWSRTSWSIRKVDGRDAAAGLPARPHRFGRRRGPFAHGPVRLGRGRGHRQLRTAVRLRNRHRTLGLRRRRLRLPDRPPAGRRFDPVGGEQPPAGPGRRPLLRAHQPVRG